jgi:hypothetical protein
MDKYMDPQTKYVDSEKNPLYAIKAYIALAGAAASVLLASGLFGAVESDSTVIRILTGISVLATGLATFKFPNAKVAEEQEYDIEDGYEDADESPRETIDYTDEESIPWADEQDDPLPIEDVRGRHEA